MTIIDIFEFGLPDGSWAAGNRTKGKMVSQISTRACVERRRIKSLKTCFLSRGKIWLIDLPLCGLNRHCWSARFQRDGAMVRYNSSCFHGRNWRWHGGWRIGTKWSFCWLWSRRGGLLTYYPFSSVHPVPLSATSEYLGSLREKFLVRHTRQKTILTTYYVIQTSI